MKVHYNMTSKEYVKYYNWAMGIFLQRRKIKKNPNLKRKSFIKIILKNYLLCIFCIPFLVFFDFFISFDVLSIYVSLFMIFTFLLNTLLLIVTTIKLIYTAKHSKKGELCFQENEILHTLENNQIITNQWENIEVIYALEKVVFIITKRKKFFLIPVDTLEQKKVVEYSKKKKQEYPSILIIEEYETTESRLKSLIHGGLYVLSFFLLFVPIIIWDNYQLAILDREVEALYHYDKKVDKTIYSIEKYGTIEKELKDYFGNLQKQRKLYEENSSFALLNLLTIEYLDKHKEDLKELFQKFQTMENTTDKAIEKIIELLEEEKAMEKIRRWNLGEVYDTIYKEYIKELVNSQLKNQWEKERYNNHLRMQYLTRMVEILTLPNACWYIEKKNLYFCEEEQLREYNELYDKLMTNNKFFSSGIKL